MTDEHDGCADCWQDTAVAAVDAAGSLLISSGPLPEMDTSGVVTGPTDERLVECPARVKRQLWPFSR